MFIILRHLHIRPKRWQKTKFKRSGRNPNLADMAQVMNSGVKVKRGRDSNAGYVSYESPKMTRAARMRLPSARVTAMSTMLACTVASKLELTVSMSTLPYDECHALLLLKPRMSCSWGFLHRLAMAWSGGRMLLNLLGLRCERILHRTAWGAAPARRRMEVLPIGGVEVTSYVAMVIMLSSSE